MKPAFPALAPDQSLPLGRMMATMDPWQHLGFQAESLTAYLNRADPSLQRHAIMIDGKLAGAMALRSPWLRGPYLELLMVLPSCQGQGVGTAALEWACDQARTVHAANFWACVSAFNHGARGFYGHMGFVETAQLDDLVTWGEAEILLRKRL